MRSAAYRVVSLVLAAVFVLSGLVSGTLGWQSLSQQARNETQSKIVQEMCIRDSQCGGWLRSHPLRRKHCPI